MRVRKTFRVPLYDCQVVLFVDDNATIEYNRLCKKAGLEPDEYVAGGVFTASIAKYYLLLSIPYLSYNTITHELYHLATHIADDRDIKEEESRAWLIGHLSGHLYKMLEKHKLVVKHG